MHIFRMQSWKNQRAVSENDQVTVFIQAALVGVLLCCTAFALHPIDP